MSDRGKGERERERQIEGEKVEVANLMPCCISPSHPCRKRRRGGKKSLHLFIREIYRPPCRVVLRHLLSDA